MLKKNVLFVAINLFLTKIKRSKLALPIVARYWDIPTVSKIKRITFENIEEMTYNLHVDTYNNFSVNGGLIVHNSIKAHMYALEPLSRMKSNPLALSGSKSDAKKNLIEVKRDERKKIREALKTKRKEQREAKP